VNAARALLDEGIEHFNLFFSHSHYDHILGLPFFQPLFRPTSTVDIWAGHLHGKMKPRVMVEEFISPPWVPEKIKISRSRLAFHDFAPGETLNPTPEVKIETAALNHPGGCVGYRIHWQDKTVALVYDIEHEPGTLDPTALELMAKADLVVYDSAYLDDEMKIYRGFGHSTWQQGIRLAKASSAKRIAFFHHMPMRTDTALFDVEQAAQQQFAEAVVAREKITVEL
jgi:phosphoribosyl 1,2-cyclic phosphodiesterase